MMIGFWFLLLIPLALIFFRDREFSNNGSHSSGPTDPLDILRVRYARGEIDTDEFKDRKLELMGFGNMTK